MTTPRGGRGERGLKVQVRAGKRRSLASKLWLDRQLNDPYVARAKREGMRSRAAYKLIEIDDKIHFLKPGARVVDLGAAPGGWTQIAAKRVGADILLSDMAANATGHRKTDHLKIMALAETAALFAREVLTPGGAFLCKVLQGGTEGTLLADLKRDFATVKHVKPSASRSDSAELYVLATGFRGSKE